MDPANNRNTSSGAPQASHRWGAGPWPPPCSLATASFSRLFRNSVSHKEKELYSISPLPNELSSLSIWNAAKVSFRKTRLTDVINPLASSFIHFSYAAHLLHQGATPLNRHCLHAGIPCSSTTQKPALAPGLSSSRWLQGSESRNSLTSLSNTTCSHSQLRGRLPAWSHSHLNTEGKTRWLSARHTSVENCSQGQIDPS